MPIRISIYILSNIYTALSNHMSCSLAVRANRARETKYQYIVCLQRRERMVIISTVHNFDKFYKSHNKLRTFELYNLLQILVNH